MTGVVMVEYECDSCWQCLHWLSMGVVVDDSIFHGWVWMRPLMAALVVELGCDRWWQQLLWLNMFDSWWYSSSCHGWERHWQLMTIFIIDYCVAFDFCTSQWIWFYHLLSIFCHFVALNFSKQIKEKCGTILLFINSSKIYEQIKLGKPCCYRSRITLSLVHVHNHWWNAIDSVLYDDYVTVLCNLVIC